MVSPQQLRSWLDDGEELAILDAREEGEFGASHLFWAVPCPLSQVEWRAPGLVPCKAARIVCIDDGSGLAEHLARWLKQQGYSNVSVLTGGTRAWEAAGFELFSGVYVPSKAFGEWVEHTYATESVDAPQLKQWIDSDRDLVVLDSRTFEEFRRMSIPTGMSVPGGELAYRIGDLAPRPETLVVVNCAGRTRSIMGAESLRRIGIPNKVVALRNGTMGWELAGLACDRGRDKRAMIETPNLARSLPAAEAFAVASGVRALGRDEIERFASDSGRTLYLLDVRDPREFAKSHLPGARNAPGGQLIQATDQWIAVRNARIVLIDDTGVRARMAAGWLRQMGHRDVFVVEGGLAALDGMRFAGASATEAQSVDAIDAASLKRLLENERNTVIVDLARSIDFREGHISGSLWGVRSRLAALSEQLDRATHVVITAPIERTARFAVDEVKMLTKGRVQYLKGGTGAWKEAGFPLAKDRTYPADDDCIDFYLRPYDRNSGVEEAMRRYLAWEVDLIDQIDRDGSVRFSKTGPLA